MKLFGFEINREKKEVIESVITQDMNVNKFSYLGNRINYDYNEPLITERLSSDFVYFGQDNAYPNILNELYYSSPFHSSIINFKQLNLVGSGYDVIYNSGLNERHKIEIEQMKFIFNDNFLNMMGMDFLIHGRLTWKIYWNEAHTKIINIERIDPAWVRAKQKDKGKICKFIISNDWSNKFSNRKMYEIPAFDSFNKEENIQLFSYQTFSPGLEYYSQPTYANAANWIYLDGQISFYHKSNIENSVNPSVAVKMYEKPANVEEQQEFINNLKKSFTGAKNSGKVMVFFSNGKDLAPDIQSIESNTLDKAFSITQEMIIKNIAFSHTIDPIIMGIATQGGLGQSQQLEAAYKIFTNTFVLPNQNKLDTILNSFFKINSLGAEIKLKNFNII